MDYVEKLGQLTALGSNGNETIASKLGELAADLPEPVSRSVVVTVLVMLAVSYVVYYEIYFRHVKSTFKLDGPHPLPLFGNMLDIIMKPAAPAAMAWHHKYGDFFLVFSNKSPRVMIRDPQVSREMSTKHYEYFPDHIVAEVFFDKFSSKFLIALKGDFWKQVRALFSPTFTSAKMRRMYKLLESCSDDLIENISEHIEDSTGEYGAGKAKMHTRDVYSLYTLDAIASCCYALKLHRQKGDKSIQTVASRNELVMHLANVFSIDFFRTLLIVALPKFLGFCIYRGKSQKSREVLAEKVGTMIRNRRSNSKAGTKFDDYLQILIDSKPEHGMDLTDMDDLENHHAATTRESLEADHKHLQSSTAQRVKLDDEYVLANAVFLLLVGLETTGSLLSHITYTLAYHQHIQDKLYEEVSKIATRDKKTGKYTFDYQKLTECEYLDAVIAEDLRYETPASQTDRRAAKDYLIESQNILIPKGTEVVFSIHAIHHDPRFWHEPEKFDPTRFLSENRDKIIPGSYTPFGQGPRHCLGMRFSLTEAKLALAKAIMQFRFTPCPGNKWPPTFRAAATTEYFETEVLVERRT